MHKFLPFVVYVHLLQFCCVLCMPRCDVRRITRMSMLLSPWFGFFGALSHINTHTCHAFFSIWSKCDSQHLKRVYVECRPKKDQQKIESCLAKADLQWIAGGQKTKKKLENSSNASAKSWKTASNEPRKKNCYKIVLIEVLLGLFFLSRSNFVYLRLVQHQSHKTFNILLLASMLSMNELYRVCRTSEKKKKKWIEEIV